MAPNAHTVLVRNLVKYLNWRGIPAWKAQVYKGAICDKFKRVVRYLDTGIKGMCDITGILPNGQRLEVEAKIPPDKPSLVQKDFMQMIRESGGEAFVAHDTEDLDRQLATFYRR